MSAFLVSKAHIDALVTAGLRVGRYGPMAWYWPPVSSADADAYQRGSPWGPAAEQVWLERHRVCTPDTASRVGAMLWAENARSVSHRYDEPPEEPEYEFELIRGRADPVVILKALECYEYQSCEHPGWRDSEAFAFCEALRRRCIGELPGYDDAPWEIASREVFPRG